jgi:hypothetical protein
MIAANARPNSALVCQFARMIPWKRGAIPTLPREIILSPSTDCAAATTAVKAATASSVELTVGYA